jgi:hypothetical protein
MIKTQSSQEDQDPVEEEQDPVRHFLLKEVRSFYDFS